MHELAVTQSMVDLVVKEAEGAGAKKVQKVNVVIGEMTGIVSDCVQFYFEFLGKDTLAEGAAVIRRRVPIQAQCQRCGQSFEPVDYDWSCPVCRNLAITITAGKELYVESIEVD